MLPTHSQYAATARALRYMRYKAVLFLLTCTTTNMRGPKNTPSTPIRKLKQAKLIKRYWTVKQKIIAAKLYQQTKNYSQVSRTFTGTAPSQIRRWVRAYIAGKYKDINMSAKTVGGGRKAFYPELEQTLYEWVVIQRTKGHGVSRNAIALKARYLAQSETMRSKFPSLSAFKASPAWLQRFMRRKNLVVRRKTTLSQHLPADLTAKVTNFHRYILDYRRNFSPDLSQMGNTDETPLWFDMPAETTVDIKGIIYSAQK